MPLRSPLFADSARLQSAATNSPPLRKGETGDAVARLQKALVAAGFAMPLSTAGGTRPPDGIYGDETGKTVGKFQLREGLSNDGIAGHDTLTRLDELVAALPADPPAKPARPAEPRPVLRPDDFRVTTKRSLIPEVV